VLAVVAAADHGLLGQCAPGTRLRLVPIAPDDADEARRAARRELARAVAGPTRWRSTDQSSSFTAVPTR